MTLLAGLIVFSALGAWLCVRQRAASAALAFGVIGTVLFCTTPLGTGLPALLNGVIQGTAQVGAQLVDGQPQPPDADKDETDDEPRPARANKADDDSDESKAGGAR